MLSLNTRRRWLPIAVLITIIIIGAWVRLHDLTSRTITHIEIYVPGIELPPDLSNPDPRGTIQQTLTSMLVAAEPHPPGYYFAMLGWTKWLGTGILALRLPSVLFGVASIILVYLLGALEKDTPAALLAAGLLAFNGHHVFWSQLAKMYAMACFLGLFSTVLLILANQVGTRRRLFLFVYLFVTLAGLATTIWYWSILLTQMLWTLWKNRVCKTVPGLFRWQWVILILGSPLLSLAIFQARRPTYLGRDPLELIRGLSRYLEFGFLFEPDGNSVPSTLIPPVVTIILVLIALLLLGHGLASKSLQQKEIVITRRPATALGILASVLAVLVTLRLARFTYGFDAEQTRLVVASSVVPLLLLGIDFLFRRQWRYLQELGRSTNNRLAVLRIPDTPSSFLAILPVGMIALASLITPLYASRGLLLYTPFLLLVLSRGLVAFARKTRFWIVIGAFLVAVHPLSVLHYKSLHHEHPTDYMALAEQWMPEIEDSDLIFVERQWATTPIFYYLKADRYHFVGSDYSKELRRSPGSRVWALSLYGIPVPSSMEKALEGYQVQKTVEARWITAVLYGKRNTAAQTSSSAQTSVWLRSTWVLASHQDNIR